MYFEVRSNELPIQGPAMSVRQNLPPVKRITPVVSADGNDGPLTSKGGQSGRRMIRKPRGEKRLDDKDPAVGNVDERWFGHSLEDLISLQNPDPDLRYILDWKKMAEERPTWAEVRAKSQAVKAYWQQWDQII